MGDYIVNFAAILYIMDMENNIINNNVLLARGAASWLIGFFFEGDGNFQINYEEKAVSKGAVEKKIKISYRGGANKY